MRLDTSFNIIYVFLIGVHKCYSSLQTRGPLLKGLSHPYNLDESTFTFRGIRSIFFIFSIGRRVSGAILFAYVP